MITYNSETQRYEIDGMGLHAGDFIQDVGRNYVDRIEYDAKGRYLVKDHDYNIYGLIVKLV